MPFVAYRKPGETNVKAILQPDKELHITKDFTESGFVFSPFDDSTSTVIFPSEICKTITTSFQNNELETQDFEKQISISEASRELHLKLVQKGIESIQQGELKKVVLSRVEPVPISEAHPIQLFQSLLKYYDSAFVYVWYHPKIGLWLGATPEILLTIEGKRFKTMALAGTQPYTTTLEVDWDKKNSEEQQLVTDYGLEALEPYSEQIHASEAKTISAGKLLHLQSQISGIFKSNQLKEVISELQPTPAVCGLPKETAKTFILKNEHYDREFYTGFLGELNLKTSISRNTKRRNVENNAYRTVTTKTALFVNLRCMQIKDKQALIYVGGGITGSSTPENEWQETVNKTSTMLAVIRN